MDVLMQHTEGKPFLFGEGGELFGCYHAPALNVRRECSVLLCSPVGVEYVRSHRAYRQLALRLAKAGFPVLRFDFYGCGDSWGDGSQARLGRWLDDISTAMEEVKQRSGLQKAVLVGFRTGGALAVIAASRREDVHGVALWDPVIDGRAYMDRLTAQHQDVMQSVSGSGLEHRVEGTSSREILGFSMSALLYSELQHINLLSIKEPPAPDVLLIESGEVVDQAQEQFGKHLMHRGVRLVHQRHPTPQLQVQEADLTVFVPNQILQSIVSWISEVYP